MDCVLPHLVPRTLCLFQSKHAQNVMFMQQCVQATYDVQLLLQVAKLNKVIEIAMKGGAAAD